MKQTTVTFLLNERNILLAMKKRGFGAGKWNGFGGKVEDGEDVLEAATREVAEEGTVIVHKWDLTRSAVLCFLYHDRPEWDQECHVFCARAWAGDPTETDEMRPQWFSFDEVPYDSMWVDDPYWLPYLLADKKIRARFTFTDEGKRIVDHTIEEVTSL